MDLKSRINAFSKLGRCFLEFKTIYKSKLKEAEFLNPWFTQENICHVFEYWGSSLNIHTLNNWLFDYKIKDYNVSKNVLVVSAGNIPLVGFHDCISVLLTGCNLVLKVSEKDSILLPLVISHLFKVEPKFKDKVFFVDKMNKMDFDAVIATGTNNSFNYFQYYFRGSKQILRSNRRSIAILDGTESHDELNSLCKDIFLYFGLGCRNVSLLFLPSDYNLDKLFAVFLNYKSLLTHDKYMRNYDYHKAMSVLNGSKVFENGFLAMKQDKSLDAPISMLYYCFYDSYSDIDVFINKNRHKIQSIISNNHTVFGQSQYPQLFDYSDDVDVISFLCNI